MTAPGRPGPAPVRAPLGPVGRLLRLPAAPPAPPEEDASAVQCFVPDRGYLQYLVVGPWLAAGPAGVVMLLGSLTLRLAVPGRETEVELFLLTGGLVALLSAAGFHLLASVRYRMTWYAVGQRSLRIRRGVWTVRESTITYENVQNTRIQQGPLQRFFGISTLEIDTAGGSSRARSRPDNPALAVFMLVFQVAAMFLPGGAAIGGGLQGGGMRRGTAPGRMEGLGDPHGVREMILNRVRRSRSAGLGDDAPRRLSPKRLTADHVEALRAVRDEFRSAMLR